MDGAAPGRGALSPLLVVATVATAGDEGRQAALGLADLIVPVRFQPDEAPAAPAAPRTLRDATNDGNDAAEAAVRKRHRAERAGTRPARTHACNGCRAARVAMECDRDSRHVGSTCSRCKVDRTPCCVNRCTCQRVCGGVSVPGAFAKCHCSACSCRKLRQKPADPAPAPADDGRWASWGAGVTR